MSQNAIRPHNAKYESLFSSEAQLPTPRASIESHHGRHCRNSSITNGKHLKDTIASGNVVAIDDIQSAMIASTAFVKKSSQKASTPAIQTSAINDQRGKSDFISSTSSSAPSSKSGSNASSSTSPSSSPTTPMSHIRRWTSNLSSSSSSKKQQQGQGNPPSSKPSSKKVRTIGPISAPQPLTTHAPYACTPLPYSDSSVVLIKAKVTTIDLSSPELRPPTKLGTSFPGVPTGEPQALELSQPVSLSKSHRTNWKDRLFYSTSKKQDRRVSTNNTMDYEWSGQEDDSYGISNVTISTQKVDRPRVRISLPLTQPTLPANQKTIPIVTTPLSPTDGLFGADVFDPFKIAPTTEDGETRSLTATLDNSRSILGTLGAPSTQKLSPQLRDQEQRATPEGSYATSDTPTESQASVIEGFAGPGKNLESGFVLTLPCLGAPNDFAVDVRESYPMPEVKDTSKCRAPPRCHLSRAFSTCSSSSDSSGASTSSIDSSPSNSADSSQSSPTGGALFFSAPLDAMAAPVATSSAIAGTPAKSLLKSNAIRIPANLMTFLPGGSSSLRNKPNSASPSPLITPPTTPPLEKLETLSKEYGAIGQPSLPTASTSIPSKSSPIAVDPRMVALKRLAYIHTLRKLREQERRPLRNSVLLHLMLLQLRKGGMTNFQCNEIGDFYTAMWAAQFPGRWDTTNMMAMTQKRTLLQQQQQLQQRIRQQQQREQEQQLSHASAKSNPKEAGSGSKELKSKRSLVFSIHSRIQSSKAKSASGDNSSSGSSSTSSNGSGMASSSPSLIPQPQFASPKAASGQSPAFKERLPLSRMPPYPLINRERKTLFTFAPVRKALTTNGVATIAVSAPTKDNSFDFNNDGSENFKTEDKDRLDQQQKGEVIRPSQTVVIPKRTTGRKGLLFRQQQQFQLLNRQQLQGDYATSAFLSPNMIATSEQRQAQIQAQLIGTRPQFAASTFTTVFDSQSAEPVDRPLVLTSSTSLLWKSLQPGNASCRSHLSLSGITGQADAFTRESFYGTRSSSSSMAGDISPLPKVPKGADVASAVASISGLPTPPLPSPFNPSFTHASLPAPLPATGSIPAGPPITYSTTDSRPPHSPSYLPATHDNIIINNTRVSLEDIRQQQQCIGGLARLSEKAQSSADRPGLPSPPLSPMMDPDTTAINISARISSSSDALHASHNMAVSESARDKQSQQFHQRQTTGGYVGRTIRSDKTPWFRNRSAQEIKTRHSMDDARRSYGSSRAVGSRKHPESKGGFLGGESGESEEEDVPLALVRRRISSDMLRSN
ncbi:hypothetical protein BGZ58_003823 [Dissophora ornata]|nr:hypothetical protein BGZ58_003823 [Dissophora ornata]